MEFVVYVTGWVKCKPEVSGRITGISNIFIEDKTFVKPETVKSLGVFHYILIVIGVIFLFFIFIFYRDVRQHSKMRKKLRKNSDFLDEMESLSELKEFIDTNMYFITDDKKEELNNISDNDSSELNDRVRALKIKIKELIQDTNASQAFVYAGILVVIIATIVIFFRLKL